MTTNIRNRALAACILALALLALLAGCGGGEPPPQDLGGGLSMTADGQILGALPLGPARPGPVDD